MLRTLILLTAALGLAAPSDRPVAPSEAAASYFEQALKLIQKHHRNHAQADWTELVPRAQSLMAGAKKPSDTYQSIMFVLDHLNERHSFLINPPSARPTSSGETTKTGDKSHNKSPLPSLRLMANQVVYLHLPELDNLASNEPDVDARYYSSLRDALTRTDEAASCGWIIDLRDNGGGNMWPMLSGLDPLLGNPPFGSFVFPDGATQLWIRSAGNIFPWAGSLSPSSPKFDLKHSSAPVAILIGSRTASSGEMTAIALVGRPQTRIFGNPSAGFTTGNKVYPLSDGALLVITETTSRDRTGKDYSGPIVPDEQLEAFQAETRAQRWLAEQCVAKSGRAAPN